jgi:hypothetical protein
LGFQMAKEKKEKNDINLYVLFFGIAILLLLLSMTIIGILENKEKTKIENICYDKYIKFRSCDELILASSYCSKAKEQATENNCSQFLIAFRGMTSD